MTTHVPTTMYSRPLNPSHTLIKHTDHINLPFSLKTPKLPFHNPDFLPTPSSSQSDGGEDFFEFHGVIQTLHPTALHILSTKHISHVFPFVIGSDKKCQVILEDVDVAPRHAELYVDENGRLFIQSICEFPIYSMGRKYDVTRPFELIDGSLFTIGSSVLRFCTYEPSHHQSFSQSYSSPITSLIKFEKQFDSRLQDPFPVTSSFMFNALLLQINRKVDVNPHSRARNLDLFFNNLYQKSDDGIAVPSNEVDHYKVLQNSAKIYSKKCSGRPSLLCNSSKPLSSPESNLIDVSPANSMEISPDLDTLPGSPAQNDDVIAFDDLSFSDGISSLEANNASQISAREVMTSPIIYDGITVALSPIRFTELSFATLEAVDVAPRDDVSLLSTVKLNYLHLLETHTIDQETQSKLIETNDVMSATSPLVTTPAEDISEVTQIPEQSEPPKEEISKEDEEKEEKPKKKTSRKKPVTTTDTNPRTPLVKRLRPRKGSVEEEKIPLTPSKLGKNSKSKQTKAEIVVPKKKINREAAALMLDLANTATPRKSSQTSTPPVKKARKK
ncbi:hypothetical protein RCL1_007804 [Eukaryota sp. TZLM3-RCL]